MHKRLCIRNSATKIKLTHLPDILFVLVLACLLSFYYNSSQQFSSLCTVHSTELDFFPLTKMCV